MRKLGFLFFFVFSPAAFLPAGSNGSPEKDKLNGVEVIVAPKTVEEESDCDSLSIGIKTLSDWQVASGSYYDPKDTLQTKNGNGRGSFDRMIQSGSIALGSAFTKFFVEAKDDFEIFFETNLNVVTPFGKGIFRLDDKMGKRFSLKDSIFLDFCEEDLTHRLKRQGRFNVYFRIHRIQKISNSTAGLY